MTFKANMFECYNFRYTYKSIRSNEYISPVTIKLIKILKINKNSMNHWWKKFNTWIYSHFIPVRLRLYMPKVNLYRLLTICS